MIPSIWWSQAAAKSRIRIFSHFPAIFNFYLLICCFGTDLMDRLKLYFAKAPTRAWSGFYLHLEAPFCRMSLQPNAWSWFCRMLPLGWRQILRILTRSPASNYIPQARKVCPGLDGDRVINIYVWYRWAVQHESKLMILSGRGCIISSEKRRWDHDEYIIRNSRTHIYKSEV